MMRHFLRRALGCAAVLMLGFAGQAEALPVRVALLGDSITQADDEHFSYRYELWRKLLDADVSFDYVGSMNANLWGNPPWPAYNGQTMDPHHEGHFGWETNEILAGRAGAGNLASWLQLYTPDVVLLHLGTNDALRGHTTASTVQELEQVIQLLQADNPAVVILLAVLIPSTDANTWRIPLLNAEMSGIARRRQTAQSRIVVVDQWTGFDPMADLYDPWHPDASGEAKMAQNWFEALMAASPLAVNLRYAADQTSLAWEATPGAQSYAVYRGLVSALGDADGDGLSEQGYGNCASALDDDTSDLIFADPSPDPTSGEAVFHLVAPVTLAGEVSLGTSSSGLRRMPAAACP